MGALSTFLEARRAESATVFFDGFGDSRWLRLGSGECMAAILALKRAAGGNRGYLMGFNTISSGLVDDGLDRGGRRTVATNRRLGYAISKPAGTAGITGPNLGTIAPATTVTLQTTLTGSSTASATFDIAGSYSAWPTSAFYVLIGNEVMYIASRSGSTLTLGATQSKDPDMWPSATNGRGDFGTTAQSHSIGDTVQLFGNTNITTDLWLGPQHAYLPTGTITTLGALSGTGTSGAVAVVDQTFADLLPQAWFYLKIDNEIVGISARSGTSLTVIFRAQYGTSAVSHVGTPTALFVDPYNYSSLQVHERSDIGGPGPVVYAVCTENPTGSSISNAAFKPVIYTLNGNLYNATFVTLISASSAANPTSNSAAGTLGGTTCLGIAASEAAPYRSRYGLVGCVDRTGACGGLYLWQAMLNGSKPGGFVQSSGWALGGRSLYEFLVGAMRTTDYKKTAINRYQFMRWCASAANKGNGKPSLLLVIDFCSNDILHAELAFVTPSQAWTAQYTRTASQTALSNGTTIYLSSTTGLPTAGHGINATTGERFSWTGVSGNTLTGCVRGDFSTTAAAVSIGDTFMFGYKSYDPLGLPANVLMFDTFHRACWDLADISSANASYPFETSGALSMLSSGTRVPNSATEVCTLWVRANAPWPTATTVSVGTAPSTNNLDEREGRYQDWATNARTRLTGVIPNFQVADFGNSVVSSDDLAGSGWLDGNGSSTLGANISDTTSTSITVTSVPSYNMGYLTVDCEVMRYTAYVSAGGGNYTVTVVRGVGGTTATTHTSGAVVVFADVIHQDNAGSIESWDRWVRKNVSGTLGSASVAYSNAALRGGVNW